MSAEPPASADGIRIVLEALMIGLRKRAAAQKRSPLTWPAYRAWLVDVHGDGPDLVLAVVRDVGGRVDAIGGVPVLVIEGSPPLRLPSRAASLYLAELVSWWVDVVPTDRGVRRAMGILAVRAERRAA